MSEQVKRYSYGYTDDGNGIRHLGLIEKPEGQLVRASDYDALRAELESLKAQEPAVIEAAARVVRWREYNELTWLIEGGIDALAPGEILYAASAALTDENGKGFIYASPVVTEGRDVSGLVEALEHIRDTIDGQLTIIAQRAPGRFLDKAPIVRSLRIHRARADEALDAYRQANEPEEGK